MYYFLYLSNASLSVVSIHIDFFFNNIRVIIRVYYFITYFLFSWKCTGGARFNILKPILKHMTPNQLYTIEYRNEHNRNDKKH